MSVFILFFSVIRFFFSLKISIWFLFSFYNYWIFLKFLFNFGCAGSSFLHVSFPLVVNGGYSLFWCMGFSLGCLLLLWSTGSRHMGFPFFCFNHVPICTLGVFMMITLKYLSHNSYISVIMAWVSLDFFFLNSTWNFPSFWHYKWFLTEVWTV